MNFNNLDQLYRSVIMDHYKNPRNKGVLDNGSMTVDMNNPTCGDRIRLTFDIEDGIIKDVITEEMGDIEALQGVSQFPARIKCATLAWKALEKGTVAKEGKAEGTTEEE